MSTSTLALRATAFLALSLTASALHAPLAQADSPRPSRVQPAEPTQDRLETRPLRSMFEIGGGYQFSDSGAAPHRIFIEARFNGITEEGHPGEFHQLLVVEGGFGVNPDPQTAEPFPYARLRVVPYRYTQQSPLSPLPEGGIAENGVGVWSVNFAPVEFTRDLGIGIRESIQLKAVGFETTHRFSEGHPPGMQRDRMQWLIRFAIEALGYTYQNAYNRQGQLVESQGLGLVDAQFTAAWRIPVGQSGFLVDIHIWELGLNVSQDFGRSEAFGTASATSSVALTFQDPDLRDRWQIRVRGGVDAGWVGGVDAAYGTANVQISFGGTLE